jgi:hypothetical protein
MGLWAVSGAFCQAYLTDGFVPDWYVKTWPKGVTLAKRLIAAGLWLQAQRDGENGWLFHEWLKVQDSKEQVEADREKWRKKKQLQRESRGEAPVMSPDVSPGDKRGDIGGESRESPGYTQPNPTQEENSGYVNPAPHQSNAREPDGRGKALARFRETNRTARSIDANRNAEAFSASLPNPIEAGLLAGIGVQIDKCLKSSIAPHAIAVGLKAWTTSDSWSPTQIPTFVHKANSRAPNGKPTEKALGYDQALTQLLEEVQTL